MSKFPFFLKLNNGPLYVYTIFCLSINVSMDCFPLLNKSSDELFHMSTAYKCLFKSLLLILLSIYPGMAALGHIILFIFNYLRNHHIVFPVILTAPFYIPTSNTQRVPVSPLPCQYLLFPFLVWLIIASRILF